MSAPDGKFLSVRSYPFVLHSSYRIGSDYLDSIECGDRIHLREVLGIGEVLATPCCNCGVNNGLLEYNASPFL